MNRWMGLLDEGCEVSGEKAQERGHTDKGLLEAEEAYCRQAENKVYLPPFTSELRLLSL